MTIGRRAFFLGAVEAAVIASAFAVRADEPTIPPPPLPSGATSTIALINGIRMHYVRAGSGPAVVLLHGWPQTWFAWRGAMERLAERFTVIAPDLRGLGLSERTSSGYDKRTIAGDIRALIDHAAGGRAHVVGHDMGGKAAYMLAHLHPDRVDRLVLVDCAIPGTENADGLRGGAWHYGFHAAAGIPEMLTRGRERDYLRAQIRAWSHRKEAIGEEAITEYARHYAGSGGMTAGFNLYRALPEDAALAATFAGRRLPMPVLAITGRHSIGSRLADALRGQADPLVEVIVEESGHFVAEEAPDLFHEAVVRFLDG